MDTAVETVALLMTLATVPIKKVFRASFRHLFRHPQPICNSTAVVHLEEVADTSWLTRWPTLWASFQTMPLNLSSHPGLVSAFQVSPYEAQPCRPCDCDPVGSLSSVCVKDDLHSDLANGKSLVYCVCTCGLFVLGRVTTRI